MPIGDFIEPIAVQVREEARARGQHPNRYEPRPPDEEYPRAVWVSRRTLCAEGKGNPVFHEGQLFCRGCDNLIRD